jgi:hypothetical protein
MKNSNNSYQNIWTTLRLITLVAISAFYCLQLSAQNNQAVFSGNWILNDSKSNFGDSPFRMASSSLVVKQEGNTLSIDRTMPGRDGEEMKMTGKYTLDGKVCENSGIMNMKTKSTVTWSADKKSIKIASSTFFDMNGENMEMKSTETWKLEGEKTLKIEATNSTPDGDMKTTLVYDKK